MFRNSLYRPFSVSFNSDILPTNIDSIEVRDDKSILIHLKMEIPEEELVQKEYIITQLSHIKIALEVLSGGLSARKGLKELSLEEGIFEGVFSSSIAKLPVGALLQSLIPQSMPGNKKIKYISEDVYINIKKELEVESPHP